MPTLNGNSLDILEENIKALRQLPRPRKRLLVVIPRQFQPRKQQPQDFRACLRLALLDLRQVGHRADSAAQPLLTPLPFFPYLPNHCPRVKPHTFRLLCRHHSKKSALLQGARTGFFSKKRRFFQLLSSIREILFPVSCISTKCSHKMW